MGDLLGPLLAVAGGDPLRRAIGTLVANGQRGFRARRPALDFDPRDLVHALGTTPSRLLGELRHRGTFWLAEGQ